MNLGTFYAEAQKYVDMFDAFASSRGLTGRAHADHICYKCGSRESFEQIRNFFEWESDFIYQSIISHRSIAIIKFKHPIVTALGKIWYMELSDQKPDGSQKDGFDHIEAYPIIGTYEEMVTHIEKTDTVVAVVRPHHSTHDIDVGDGFLFRCTHGPLIEKIKGEEMR